MHPRSCRGEAEESQTLRNQESLELFSTATSEILRFAQNDGKCYINNNTRETPADHKEKPCNESSSPVSPACWQLA